MKLRRLCRAAITGGLYAALTVLLAPISFGPLQFRVSEALCVLPWFFPETCWGLYAGCLLANLLAGTGAADVLVGPLATLAAALMTAGLRRRKHRLLGCLPPIAANGVLTSAALAVTVGSGDAFFADWLLFGVEVAAGEAGVMLALGLPLMAVLDRMTKKNKG